MTAVMRRDAASEVTLPKPAILRWPNGNGEVVGPEPRIGIASHGAELSQDVR